MAERVQIGDRHFLTVPPHRFTDEAGRLGEGDIIERHWHVQEGDVVVDVGACEGLWTLPSCALGAFVYAVEPNIPSCAVIDRLLALNGFSGRCHVVNAALSDAAGKHPADLRACCHPYFMGVPRITTLDDMVRDLRIPKVDWIKVDVEGGELLVVEGGAATLRRDRPVVVVEDHSDIPLFAGYCAAHRTRARIREILEGMAYVVADEPFDNRSFIIGRPGRVGAST